MGEVSLANLSALPLPQPRPDAFAMATAQYPLLSSLGLVGSTNYGAGEGRKLEYWPQNEPGNNDARRPNAIPMDKNGVEIYDKSVRPEDVLGDVVSHQLIDTDPYVKNVYRAFTSSLKPEQRQRLQDQYRWSQQNDNETRPYEEWESRTGIPAYFRGYAFKQWPDEFNQQAYTPGQRAMFDKLNEYLRKPR